MAGRRRALRTLSANPALRRVLLAWLATSTAVWGSALVLAVHAFEEGGAAAVGLMAVVRTLPGVLTAALLAREGDRRSRRTVLMAVNALRAAALAAVALGVAAGAPLVVTYALVALPALVGAAYKPSQAALLPLLARTPSELSRANVAASMLVNLGFLTGSLGGGVLLTLTSTATALGVLSGLFVLSLGPLLRVGRDRPAGPGAGAERGPRVLDGFRAVAADRRSLALVAALGGLLLVEGAADVLAVASALGHLGMGEAGAGTLWAAWGVGAIAGGGGALGLVDRRRLALGLTAGALVLGAALALEGLLPAAPVAMVLLAAAGVGYTLVEVAASTMLQRLAGDDVLARVFGVVEAVSVLGVAAGGAVAGLVLDAFGPQVAWILAGAVMPLTALACRSALVRLELGPAAGDREYGIVRRDPIFAPLPIAIKERLACSLVEVRPDDGAVVVAEGEEGDRYYLVAEGELEVVESGRYRRTLGPGDGFGEIALLRDVPRTATVRAGASVVLLALERGSFLEALTGQSGSIRAADALVSERWAGPG